MHEGLKEKSTASWSWEKTGTIIITTLKIHTGHITMKRQKYNIEYRIKDAHPHAHTSQSFINLRKLTTKVTIIVNPANTESQCGKWAHGQTGPHLDLPCYTHYTLTTTSIQKKLRSTPGLRLYATPDGLREVLKTLWRKTNWPNEEIRLNTEINTCLDGTHINPKSEVKCRIAALSH